MLIVDGEKQRDSPPPTNFSLKINLGIDNFSSGLHLLFIKNLTYSIFYDLLTVGFMQEEGKGKQKNIGTRLQLANRKMGKYIM